MQGNVCIPPIVSMPII